MLSAPLIIAAIPGAGPVVATTAGVPVAGITMLLFAAVFVGYFVYVGVREWRAIRREEQPTNTRDYHSVRLPDLGPTMADGGEPEADDAEADRK